MASGDVRVACRRARSRITKLEDVRRLTDRLAKMSNAALIDSGIGTKRSEIIVGGAIVYTHLMERLGLKGFRYSPLGLGNGILEQMLADVDVRASVHRKMESERWAGVLEVCRRYNVDQRKAEPVREHVVQLYDELARVHDLPEEYRLWLESAAMMATGKFMNHQGHHRHTQYILANSEIFGFSPEQRAIVAAIARYLGKSRPDAMERPMRAVPADEQAHVERAVVLLRLAVALNPGPAPARRCASARDVCLSQAGVAGTGAGARRRGAGGVVAEERGDLLPRGSWGATWRWTSA